MEEAKKAKMDDGERSGVASKSVPSLICVPPVLLPPGLDR